MENKIPQEIIDKVRNVPLDKFLPPYKKKISGKYYYNCPFHQDRNPSFMWDPKNNHFHCFGIGCQKHGDVITFIMELSSVSFREAIEYLKKYI